MAKSIEDMMAEEEQIEARTRHESAQARLEREIMMRRLAKMEGKQAWKMYSSNGKKSGLDWDLLRMRSGVQGARSIAQAPSFGGNRR